MWPVKVPSECSFTLKFIKLTLEKLHRCRMFVCIFRVLKMAYILKIKFVKA